MANLAVTSAENQHQAPTLVRYASSRWSDVAEGQADLDSEQDELEEDLAQSVDSVYGEIVKASEQVVAAQPASEYAQALLLAYGYGRTKVSEYAVNRRTIDALRKILAQIEEVTKDEQTLEAFLRATANQPLADQEWLQSLALDTDQCDSAQRLSLCRPCGSLSLSSHHFNNKTCVTQSSTDTTKLPFIHPSIHPSIRIPWARPPIQSALSLEYPLCNGTPPPEQNW